MWNLAFEGPAHPYKENLVKFEGKTKIAELPGVKTDLLKANVKESIVG